MRRLILLASLALASCGGGETANNDAVAEETKAIEVGPVNDITAIDAATGEAANMAEDVDFTLNEAELNELDSNAAASTSVNNSQ